MKKALIIVDPQVDFCGEGGSLSTPHAVETARVVADTVAGHGKDFDDIFVTFDTHGEDYPETTEGRHLPVAHCIDGTPGWKADQRIWDALKGVRRNVHSVEKKTFGYTGWKNIFKDGEWEFYIMGFCTDICVVSNALILKAQFPGSEVTLVENCCAGVTAGLHESAVAVMKSCQINVVPNL